MTREERVLCLNAGSSSLKYALWIGEHSSELRREICARLAVFGVEIDEQKNAESADRIESNGSKSAVRVLEAKEERVMARHAARITTEHGA